MEKKMIKYVIIIVLFVAAYCAEFKGNICNKKGSLAARINWANNRICK